MRRLSDDALGVVQAFALAAVSAAVAYLASPGWALLVLGVVMFSEAAQRRWIRRADEACAVLEELPLPAGVAMQLRIVPVGDKWRVTMKSRESSKVLCVLESTADAQVTTRTVEIMAARFVGYDEAPPLVREMHDLH